MTRQRKAILQTLKAVDTHPTADEIYQMVRQQLPTVSLGTVYRNLEILCQHGLVRKLELGGSQRRYDGDINEHYHVRCIHCGRVGDVEVTAMSVVEHFHPEHRDFEIIGHRLDFIGICSECKKEHAGVQRTG